MSAAALVELCELLESRCWMYHDEARGEYVSYDFTAQLAALGWLPKGQYAPLWRSEHTTRGTT